jgi:acyl carrier protein
MGVANMADRGVAAADKQAIGAQILTFILDALLAGEEPVTLTPQTPLVSSGIIDSLNSLRVGLFLEKTFGIEIAPEELADPENLESIEAMTRLVMAKLRA